MANVSQAQIQEYKDCFVLYDKDNKGQIDVSQLAIVVRSLGQRPTDAQLNVLVKEKLRKNTFTVEDLVTIMKHLHANPPAGEDEVRDAFRVFDRDGNGYVSAQELRHVMTNLGEKLTDEEVDEMLRAVDVADGQIVYDDVVRLMVQ